MSIRLALLALLALAACKTKDDEDTSTATQTVDTDTDTDTDTVATTDSDTDGGSETDTPSTDDDQDNDGFTAENGDCDDNDATVFPGAEEQVDDDIDQDCDGGDACFVDADGDHAGDTATVTSADTDCLDAGESPNHDDCYDANPDAVPGQKKYFDADRGDGEFDYDCDGKLAPEYPKLYACTAGKAANEGWVNVVPACGIAGTLRTNVDPATCTYVEAQAVQRCH